MSKRQVDEAFIYPNSQSAEKDARTKTMSPDKNLEYVYETADITTKSQRLFTEQGMMDIASVLQRISDLTETSLPYINKATQKQVHKFCLWHDKFLQEESS